MRAANVTWRGISLHDVKEMDFRPDEAEVYELRVGDILLAEASGSASEVGKPAVWRDEVPGACFQNTLIRVRAPGPLVPFLHLHFMKDAVVGAFASASRGVGIHHLGAKALSDWEILLPPLREQHRIVEAVESYFTRLDDAVATLERVERNLKRYRASVLKAAVEGRLVPTEAELARQEGRDYEPADVLLARILDERRRRWEQAELAKTKVSGKPPNDDRWKSSYKEPAASDPTSLYALPEGWCWARTDQLFGFVTSGSRGWAKYYSEAGSTFLRVGNLDHDSISLDLGDVQRVAPPAGTEGTRTRVETGDILISITADVGMVALVPASVEDAYINQHVALARPVPLLDLSYLAWYLASRDGGQRQFRSLQRGATKVGLGLDDIRSVDVPLPPIAEQQRIVAEVERRLSATDEVSAALRRNRRRASRLRQSVLRCAFEGKLAEQRPDDEPASALLERIKAERDAGATTRSKTVKIRRHKTGGKKAIRA